MNIHTSKLIFLIVVISMAMSAAIPALSATDQESSAITLQFNENIIIDNVDPVTISDPTPGDFALGTDSFCVAGTGFSTFGITFANAGTDPSFFLISSNGTSPIMYDVLFSNSTGGIATPVTAGVPRQGLMLQASDCANNNARFDIAIPFSDWGGRESDGPFTGTLVITVESE
ncbi:hypothetical protein [uncultured Microbulbifer sp.]|uniref:hypothetical protein n=1 Tax=uncultured Microbulbifer sp. TaxID=348147 RepID=UPI002616E49C|nr:hypothetical protein [uncultured Microbulbifer sp.]